MKNKIYEEQKKLVLARLKTLKPDAKLMSGGKAISVKDIINHVEKNDPFGKDIIKGQIKMLQVIASV